MAWIISKTNHASSYVCCRSIYFTFPFPLWLKKATIEPSCPFLASARFSQIFSRVSSSFISSAFLTISSPQQCLVCFRMLPVDPLSAVLRKYHTIRWSDPFPLQIGVEQTNSWHGWQLTAEILGQGSKKAYIGEFHVWAACSEDVEMRLFIILKLYFGFTDRVHLQGFFASFQWSQSQSWCRQLFCGCY